MPHRLNATTFAKAGLLEFAAQGEHLGIHRTGPATEGGPGHTQEFLAAPDHTGGHQQSAEEGEFSGAQLDRLVPQHHLTQQQMNFERSDTDPLLKTSGAAPQQGATTGGEFLKTEWLAEHVVCAPIQEGNERF